MAKLQQQKASKEYVCSKCGKVINKGEMYYKIVARFSTPKKRCACCKPQRSELTTSEYLSWLYDLQDNLESNWKLREEGTKDDLYAELEMQRDELQERLDNIPEQLQEADAGQTLQDRIDSLENAMDELDCLEYPCREDIESEDMTEEEIDEEYERVLDDYECDLAEIIRNIE